MPQEVSSPAELDSVLAGAGSKLVVIDFHATWCGPCHAIAPVYERLSKQYTNSVFLKVDVDRSPQIAQRYSVSAMPTFLFIKNKQPVDTLRGANPAQLQALVAKHSSGSAGAGAGGSFAGKGQALGDESTAGPSTSSGANGSGPLAAGLQNHTSLLPLIDRTRSSALNEQSAHPLSSIIRGPSGGSYLLSDADEQLILHIAFSQKVRLNAILLRTTPSSLKQAPKEVKVYANKPNLGFDDVESEGVQSTMVVDLTEEQVKSGENGGGGIPFQLKFVKFQNVDSVAIAVVSNQGGEDETRIDAIDIFGSPVDTTDMSALKKVEAEGEPRNLGGMPPSRTGLKGGSSGGSSRFYMTSSSSGNQFGGGNGGVSKEAENKARNYSEKSSSSINTEQTSNSSNGGSGHGRRRSSTSTSRTSVPPFADDADDGNDETIKDYIRRPMGPPRFTPKDDAELLADQVADNLLGGWHYAPLIIALAPPIGAVLGGKAEHWSNAILVLLASFWLYQFLRVPWEMYYAARTRKILNAGIDEGEQLNETPEQKRNKQVAQVELQRAELIALAWCVISPIAGAWMLQWLKDSLSDGASYLTAFNIRLFMLAAGIKPWMHLFKLLRRRLLFLQEEVHYPNTQVEVLSRRMRQMESELSTLRKLFATKNDVRLLRDGIDMPLSQLSRAVRRYEKKEEHLRLTAEDKFTLVENRLEDLLREVAINAELIENERQERERVANIPMSLFQAVRYALGQRTSQYRHYLHDAPRSLPSAQSLGISSPEDVMTPGGGANGVSVAQQQQYSRSSAPATPNGGNVYEVYPNAASGGSPPSRQAQDISRWYEKGSLYYVFLPLNLTNSVLKYAGDKTKSVTQDAYYSQASNPQSPFGQQHGFKRLDHTK